MVILIRHSCTTNFEKALNKCILTTAVAFHRTLQLKHCSTCTRHKVAQSHHSSCVLPKHRTVHKSLDQALLNPNSTCGLSTNALIQRYPDPMRHHTQVALPDQHLSTSVSVNHIPSQPPTSLFISSWQVRSWANPKSAFIEGPICCKHTIISTVTASQSARPRQSARSRHHNQHGHGNQHGHVSKILNQREREGRRKRDTEKEKERGRVRHRRGDREKEKETEGQLMTFLQLFAQFFADQPPTCPHTLHFHKNTVLLSQFHDHGPANLLPQDKTTTESRHFPCLHTSGQSHTLMNNDLGFLTLPLQDKTAKAS